MTKLNELNTRPATLAISSRADMRYLATLAAFWLGKGERVKSVSELVRLSLEALSDVLVTSHEVDFVPDHFTAMEILTRAGLLTKNSKILTKNLHLAQTKENSSSSSLNISSLTTSPSPLTPLHQKVATSGPAPTTPELTLAQASLENLLDADLATRSTQAQARTKDFKNSLGVLPEETTK